MPIKYNLLHELANSDLIPKEDIMSQYGLTEPSKELVDSETLNVFKAEYNSLEWSSYIWTPDMVPVVMKENCDNEIGYFIEYNDLKSLSKSKNIPISSAFNLVCECNNIDYDDACVLFRTNMLQEANNINTKIHESSNVNYKLYNKLALSDFYEDLVDLRESNIMMLKLKEE